MRRRPGRSKEAPELDITAFLNLMVVLVPFLLVSAVFSRITILELNLQGGAPSEADDKPQMNIEVIIRQGSIELRGNQKVIAKMNKIDNKNYVEGLVQEPTKPINEKQIYDLPALSKHLLKIKASYPDKLDALILLEPDIEYRNLVGVMDAVRGAEIKKAAEDGGEPQTERKVLFPDISIGDAP
ncbi:MAG: biopolymer transporter ExbD [Gammaproteobacteria bacterium]|nr:biopolymer transporter ExbD [Gammaproteobacteria bacterium]MDH5628755.1 biopolymer transporter ExbD [Gammaproteobacteria bacterium]